MRSSNIIWLDEIQCVLLCLVERWGFRSQLLAIFTSSLYEWSYALGFMDSNAIESFIVIIFVDNSFSSLYEWPYALGFMDSNSIESFIEPLSL